MPPLVKKIITWLLWGFLIYAIVTNPERAADIVRSIWDILSESVLNIGRFFNELVGG